MSPQYGELGSLAAEIGPVVWAPQLISTAFASWLRYCSDVAQQKSTKLCTMFGRLLGCYTIHFRGLLPSDGILPGAMFTLRPLSLAFSYIDSVTALHSSSGRQPNFAAWYKDGITELSQRVPPIFGRAAITLGIGPHSIAL